MLKFEPVWVIKFYSWLWNLDMLLSGMKSSVHGTSKLIGSFLAAIGHWNTSQRNISRDSFAQPLLHQDRSIECLQLTWVSLQVSKFAWQAFLSSPDQWPGFGQISASCCNMLQLTFKWTTEFELEHRFAHCQKESTGIVLLSSPSTKSKALQSLSAVCSF